MREVPAVKRYAYPIDPPRKKPLSHEALDQQVAEYLARGGSITRVEQGATGDDKIGLSPRQRKRLGNLP